MSPERAHRKIEAARRRAIQSGRAFQPHEDDLVAFVKSAHPAVQEAVIREIAANLHTALRKDVAPLAVGHDGGAHDGTPASPMKDADTSASAVFSTPNIASAQRHPVTGKFTSPSRRNVLSSAPAVNLDTPADVVKSNGGLFNWRPGQVGAA